MFFLGAAFAFTWSRRWPSTFFLGFQQPGTLLVDGDAARGRHGGNRLPGFGGGDLDLTIKFIVAFGLCFQLPVSITLLGKAGIVTAQGLVATRKYAIIGILVLAAIATPPDVVSQMILFSAIYGLYEISIQIVKRMEKKKTEELRREGILGEDEELYETGAADETKG